MWLMEVVAMLLMVVVVVVAAGRAAPQSRACSRGPGSGGHSARQ